MVYLSRLENLGAQVESYKGNGATLTLVNGEGIRVAEGELRATGTLKGDLILTLASMSCL